MTKLKKKGFTLIELIAVLVIMSILALIVTPLVMNIIRKARISADKRSVDAYGRSIELAIASHLLDTGKFASSIDELTIEYSGNKVECETTQINSDSSVYLSNCKVNNREVTNYTYGSDKSPSYEAYSVGDEVTYNGVDYYVLKDSGIKEDTVTLLKTEPLTVEEVNLYGGVGTEDNHVNNYVEQERNNYLRTSYNVNSYGGVAYFSNEQCLRYTEREGCTSDYELSDIKYIVDSWANNKVINMLKNVRLLKTDEIEIENTEYDACGGNGCIVPKKVVKEGWIANQNYSFWTMNRKDSFTVYIIESNGSVVEQDVSVGAHNFSVVRPVVELYKNDGITRKNNGNN